MAKKKAPAKKSKGYFSKAPVRRLMKKEGADLVADAAIERLIDYLEKQAAAIIKDAIKLVKADKRRRITAEDIKRARGGPFGYP